VTLDDCDIPEVQALYEYNSDSKFLDRAPAALEALYERVKELEAERDEWKHKWEADQRMDR